MKKIFILAALCLSVFLSFSVSCAVEINQDAPLFSLRDSNGEFFHISDNVGPKKKEHLKGIILNFFSSTCIPCKRELPILNSLADEFSKKKIKIVIVGYQEDMEKTLEFLETLKVDKPLILADPHGWVGRKYMVKGLPMTFFISSDGKIKDIIPGEMDNFKKAMKEKAEKLLK